MGCGGGGRGEWQREGWEKGMGWNRMDVVN